MVERVLAKDGVGVRFPVSAPRERSERERGHERSACALRVGIERPQRCRASTRGREAGPRVLSAGARGNLWGDSPCPHKNNEDDA